MRWSARLLRAAALLSGGWFLLVYGVLASIRMRYPFELEWMEGAILEQVRHVAEGHALYAEPSIAFLPFQYPPLYFYASAGLSKLVGVSFLTLRALSVAASLGSFALIYAIVRRESGSATGGFLAAALYAACFRLAGAWFDLARIDSLLLLLVLASAYTVRFHVTVRGAAASGLMLALATFTKQSAFVMALPVLAYLVVTSVRRGVMAGVVFALIAGAGTWALNVAHHGWYWYYVFRMPARMQSSDAVAVDFWRGYLLRQLPIAVALALAYLGPAHPSGTARARLFYGSLAVGMIGSAWLAMLHAGAYDNNLMPACAAIAILFGLSASADGAGYVPVLAVVQFALLLYDPRAQLPVPGSRQAGRHLVATIASTPGDVFVPQHGYLAVLAGKPSYAHSMAVYDVLRAGDEKDATRLVTQLHEALSAHRFGAVVIDRTEAWSRDDLEREYKRALPALTGAEVFWPVTGLRTRPEWIYVPR